MTTRLSLLLIVLALVAIACATYSLSVDVLAFDWSTAATETTAHEVVVSLPAR